MSHDRIEHVCRIWHEMGSDHIVPWEKCMSEYLRKVRKKVREILYAAELADKEANQDFEASRK